MTATTKNRVPKVLVVDDEQMIADTLKAILTRSGYDARATYCGEAAVETARNFQPDMLLTDVAMPGINGIETAIKVREMLPHCKVLLFSGQVATADLLEKARAQNLDFELLCKPIHPSDLLARMHEA